MTRLLDRLQQRAAVRPDAPALNGLSYAELLARVWAEAAGLAALGVGPGDRVAVLALNHARTVALLFACEALGAMLVPLNWRLAGPELDWIVGDAEPRVLFVDGVAAEVSRAGMTVRDIDDPPSPLPAREGPGVGHAPLPLTRRDGEPHGHHGEAAPNPPPAPPLQGGEARPVLLVYTSGTTGRPKGALLSSAALLANAALSVDMHGLTEADHVLTVLPLFHVGGLNIQTVPALLAGARVTLLPRFEPGATLDAIGRERPTLTVLVPATMQAMAAHPGWAAAVLSSLRAVTTGSTVVQPAVVAPFTARGVPVLQVYGSTETAPIAIYTRRDREYPADSTGHCGPGCRARSTAGGEILLAGPQLFSGYWRNPAATAAALADGWFRTGDVGTQAADGSWTVHDRLKSMIISGGENIYPAEIERVLHEMPAIAEAAVVGVPDPRWQEVPEAWVVLRPGAACTEAEVVAHLHAQLARFKAPRRVRFVAALPRNAMGKVQHALLKGPAC